MQGFKTEISPTPYDERSKLALHFKPFREATVTSENHLAHPSVDKRLRKLGGQAVRHGRVQVVEGLGGVAQPNRPEKSFGEHEWYHYYLRGPWLPTTEQEQFDYVVWATSLYVPEIGIEVGPKGWREVRHTPEEIEIIRRRIRIGSEEHGKKFMKKYVMKQDIKHVSPSLIDEFIGTKNVERRTYLGHWLLSQAAMVATDQIDQPFRKAHKEGLVAPQETPKVSNLVQRKIQGRKNRDHVIYEYRALLRDAA
jgi:hypothetical protein